MSAQTLEACLLGVGKVLRLERDAWSMVERQRQATNEYAPPPKQTIELVDAAVLLLYSSFLLSLSPSQLPKGSSAGKKRNNTEPV